MMPRPSLKLGLLLCVATLSLGGCDSATMSKLRESDDPLARMVGNTARVMTPVEKVPLEEERAHGSAMAAMLLGASPLLRDDKVQDYVNDLGRWIALHSERPDIPWRFGVMDTDDVNAFALPGGYVLISTGLLRKLRSEAELANVLAHEIVHGQNRHHLRAFRAEAGANVLKDSLNVVAEQRASAGKNNANFTLAANATKGYLLEGFLVRGLDRKLEYEADAQGVVLAARAGFNPYAMAGVLQTLGEGSPEDAGMAQWFKTHPHPKDRLQHLGELMGDRLENWADLPEDNRRFQAMLRRLPPPKKAQP